MKKIALLIATIAGFLACENPVSHFTDNEPKVRYIDCGELDFGEESDSLTYQVSDSTCTRFE